MKNDSAHKSGWVITEVVFGIPFLLSIAVQFVIPLSLPQGILRQALMIIGIVFIAIGIGFIVLARRELARFSQPTDPGRPTSKIVTTGVFSISRNPLYLGSTMMLFGIALTFNMPWALIALLFSIIVCYSVLIVPEEKYLAEKFGDEYREYTTSVRRWLGRK
jgi:protein-S-isoprenylcysteine O-methyltransferase Ste14